MLQSKHCNTNQFSQSCLRKHKIHSEPQLFEEQSIFFERLSLEKQAGSTAGLQKRATFTRWIRESFPLEKALRSSSWDLFSSDSSCHTYMFLWVKRLLFAASLLASDNSTILCSSDLIFESIALIIWNTAVRPLRLCHASGYKNKVY